MPPAIVVLACAVMAACDDRSALTASEVQKLNPAGLYRRVGTEQRTLRVIWGRAGGWLVETKGRPPAGQPKNACWRVHAGTLHGAELVSTSDANDDGTPITREGLAPYQGFILDFARDGVAASGPEAFNATCDLHGKYVRVQ